MRNEWREWKDEIDGVKSGPLQPILWLAICFVPVAGFIIWLALT